MGFGVRPLRLLAPYLVRLRFPGWKPIRDFQKGTLSVPSPRPTCETLSLERRIGSQANADSRVYAQGRRWARLTARREDFRFFMWANADERKFFSVKGYLEKIFHVMKGAFFFLGKIAMREILFLKETLLHLTKTQDRIFCGR